jgi:hypothetical protein
MKNALVSREVLKFSRPLFVIALSLGTLVACGDDDNEGGKCFSKWTDFQVAGDPEVTEDQATWRKAALVTVDPEQRGTQQQAGFTVGDEFHESDPFASPGDNAISFKVGKEALDGSVRVIAEHNDPVCDQFLDLTVEEVMIDGPKFQKATQPIGWHEATR